MAGNFHYDRKKKSSSRLSGGYAINYDRKKKKIQAGNFHYERKKKKFQSSVWRVCQFLVLAGNWQFFCCGGKFSLRPEKKNFQSSAITTGKKKSSCRLSGGLVLSITTGKKKSSSRLSGGLVLAITTGKKKVPVVCLAGCQFLVLAIMTGKKKVPVVIKFVLVKLELKLIQIG